MGRSVIDKKVTMLNINKELWYLALEEKKTAHGFNQIDFMLRYLIISRNDYFTACGYYSWFLSAIFKYRYV